MNKIQWQAKKSHVIKSLMLVFLLILILGITAPTLNVDGAIRANIVVSLRDAASKMPISQAQVSLHNLSGNTEITRSNAQGVANFKVLLAYGETSRYLYSVRGIDTNNYRLSVDANGYESLTDLKLGDQKKIVLPHLLSWGKPSQISLQIDVDLYPSTAVK